jgi:hypothetical protein
MTGKNLFIIGGKQGFEPGKARKVITVDHQDWEL